MTGIANKHWPLIAAVIILWSVVALLLMVSMKDNQGHLIYALDDAYIHMAMAKNFSQHGVWGITRYEFSSSTSSILWTLILSGIYFLGGIKEAVPLILNIIFATLIVFSVYVILKPSKASSYYIFLVLLTIIFLTPLPALIFLGLEHVFHALVTILFVYFAAKVFYQEDPKIFNFNASSLWILTPCLTLTRYESLFLVFVVGILFMFRKRWLYSIVLIAGALPPLVIYGVISKVHGWFWLPNSVLLKGNQPDLTSLANLINFLISGGTRLFSNLDLLFLLMTVIVLYIFNFQQKNKNQEVGQFMVVVFIGASLLHILFASTGWYYRYEAYLISLGLLGLAVMLCEYIPSAIHLFNTNKILTPRNAAIILLIALLILPFSKRTIFSLIRLPQATTNTYEFQYQTGLFLKQYYPGASIAIQDLGAINFLADIQCLDLLGLGSIEVARQIQQNKFNLPKMYDLINKKADIVVVYDGFFYRRESGKFPLPAHWSKAGRWEINNNVVAGYGKVAFYATNPSQENILISNLKQFASKLPPSVIQSGKYTES